MSPPKKPATTLESPSQLLEGGIKKGKSNLLEHREDKEGSVSLNTSRKLNPLFSMQESLPIAKKMTLKDKLNFCVKHTQMQNLYGRLEADSILGGESLSPFWNEFTKEISDALSAPTPTEPSDLASHLLSGSASRQAANSWFDRERNLSPSQELVEDILSILHCFSGRLYGLRKYKKQVQQAIQDKSEKPDEKIDPQRCVEDQGISI